MSAPTTTPSLRERVAAAVPESDTLAVALAVVKAVPPRPFDVERAHQALVRTFAAEVEQTGEWPADAVERWLEVQRQADEAAAHAKATWRAAEHLKAAIADAHEDAAESKIKVLRAELADVLNRAAQLDEVLGTVHDSDAAIEGGPELIGAWQGLAELVDRAREVFEMHRQIVVPHGADTAVVRSYGALVPLPDAPERERVLDEHGRTYPLDRDRLRSLAVSEAGPWLPSRDELQQARDQQTTHDPTPVRREYGLHPLA